MNRHWVPLVELDDARRTPDVGPDGRIRLHARLAYRWWMRVGYLLIPSSGRPYRAVPLGGFLYHARQSRSRVQKGARAGYEDPGILVAAHGCHVRHALRYMHHPLARHRLLEAWLRAVQPVEVPWRELTDWAGWEQLEGER